ncbi:exopolysaccharide biosynthesis protein [Lyngbya confervoides]|uniref:Exopolysaccharide biosynthesis protein n=1 Tax=Lyngbya confervoides BDU141951 TaxID=1574623 RepID=A0ABD4T4I2_9CYAN|nr:exopolysaccharide biosynthesis protein [Lyngbya confervoides]MCM1983389.1 exopolysaccharide biosynthesis protein [Lyngbya confervoides BDU141951]
MASLSRELNLYVFETCQAEHIALADLLSVAEERVFGLLFVILALPSALPIPAPGYSIPFGLALFILAVQLMLGWSTPWLPHRLAKHPFSRQKAQGILRAGTPWLQKIEAVTRPRMTYICKGRIGNLILGAAIALMAISMMIPIPGTNTIPAMGIFVLGFGLLEDDGVMSLVGLAICTVGLVVSTSIIGALLWGGSSLVDLAKIWLNAL